MATIKGKWKWNEMVNCRNFLLLGEGNVCEISFVSNEKQFSAIAAEWLVGYHYLYYCETPSFSTDYTAGASPNFDDEFVIINDDCRVIDFGESDQEITESFYNWFITNASNIDTIQTLTFNANVIIPHNLTVQGTTITENAESILVQGAVMVVNSNNAEFEVTLVGTVYRTGSGDYGILYNPTTQAVELGYGTYDEDLNTFTFNEGEGKPVAVRDLSAEDDGSLVMWDAENYCLTGVKIGDGLTVSENKVLSITTPNILTGTTAPTNEIGNDGDIYLWYEE